MFVRLVCRRTFSRQRLANSTRRCSFSLAIPVSRPLTFRYFCKMNFYHSHILMYRFLVHSVHPPPFWQVSAVWKRIIVQIVGENMLFSNSKVYYSLKFVLNEIFSSCCLIFQGRVFPTVRILVAQEIHFVDDADAERFLDVLGKSWGIFVWLSNLIYLALQISKFANSLLRLEYGGSLHNLWWTNQNCLGYAHQTSQVSKNFGFF